MPDAQPGKHTYGGDISSINGNSVIEGSSINNMLGRFSSKSSIGEQNGCIHSQDTPDVVCENSGSFEEYGLVARGNGTHQLEKRGCATNSDLCSSKKPCINQTPVLASEEEVKEAKRDLWQKRGALAPAHSSSSYSEESLELDQQSANSNK